MNVGDRAVWPLVAPLDRADRYLYPFFSPAQQRGEGRNDQAERLRRAAILIAPPPTPGPTPSPVRDGSAAGGACRGKTRRDHNPLKRPTIMPGDPQMFPRSSPISSGAPRTASNVAPGDRNRKSAISAPPTNVVR